LLRWKKRTKYGKIRNDISNLITELWNVFNRSVIDSEQRSIGNLLKIGIKDCIIQSIIMCLKQN